MRILVGGIIQESNTFSTAQSSMDYFKNNLYYIGAEMNQSHPVQNELSGFQQALTEQGATLLPSLYTSAVSAGPITRDAFNQLKETCSSEIKQTLPCDGVLFALHGAWVAEGDDDADGEIVALIRQLVGPEIPIVITLDSHANVTKKIIDHVNGIVGYRTFPHIDQKETGYRAGKLLFSILTEGLKPRLHLKKVPMILQAENQQTYRGPMYELWTEAKKGEQLGNSMMTSLFAVQPWLDINEMGFAVVVMGDNDERAQAEADRLARIAWQLREQFQVTLYQVQEVVSKIENKEIQGPVIVSDSADSPGAGSPGDSNYVLRTLIDLGAHRWLNALLCMVDEEAARQATEAGVGQAIQLQVGHRLSTTIGSPFTIEGTVKHISNGKFHFGQGYIQGVEANMGYAAVIEIGHLSILLMQNPTFTGDPAMYRSVGLEPLHANLVLVKSANQFRGEYENISQHIYILDTPGASTANLTSLPFKKIPRPMYPFDQSFLY